MTPSEWLWRNLSDVVVAVAQAGSTLAGSATEGNASQPNPCVQEVARDE